MKVVKRDGTIQDVDFAKIHWRIKSVCSRKDILSFQQKERPTAYDIYSHLSEIKNADVDLIAKKTIEGMYNMIPTTELDALSSNIAQELVTVHPDNSILAQRITASNLQKNVIENLYNIFNQNQTPSNIQQNSENKDIQIKETVNRENIANNLFRYSMESLYYNMDKHGEVSPNVAPYVLAIAIKYSHKINDILNLTRDFTNHDYLGLKMLESGYLFRVHNSNNTSNSETNNSNNTSSLNVDKMTKENNVLVETPSLADLRIAIGLTCAPSPCPDPYAKEVLQSFILNNQKLLLKQKYENMLDSELQRIVREIKNVNELKKYMSMQNFKRQYWNYRLKQELENITVSESEWETIRNNYSAMTCGLFTPASPTRFAAGTLRPQGSSCFLISMKSDSLQGIYDTLNEQSQISKHSGGVGLHCTNVRSKGSYIAGTSGKSDGIKPMLQVFNASSNYVNQSGRRPGSVAVYNEMFHADILDFVQLRRKKGAESDRARNLFYGLWISDEFFRCWKNEKDWYLFDPSVCPKLYQSYDEKFSSQYLTDEQVNKTDYRFTYYYRKYIREGKWETKINPDALMREIVETVRDGGVPYMLCKDAANRKSNQKNLGTITHSNLCSEIIQYSDSENTAVCNLSSICLNKFLIPVSDLPVSNTGSNDVSKSNENEFIYNVTISESKNEREDEYKTFSFSEFDKIVRLIVRNIDNMISTNYNPTAACEKSNMDTRPMGIGVQGEADVMAALRLPWNSSEANKLRYAIYEQLYYSAVSESVELAKTKGAYPKYPGSPMSKGLFQFDLWEKEGKTVSYKKRLDWDKLRTDVLKYGVRNSLLTTIMPTASTSYIMNNSPSIEPFNSLFFIRKSGSGDVTLVNNALVKDLKSLNLWNTEMRNKILQEHGSIQNITEIPLRVRESYLTCYDMEPESLIDASFCRGFWIDQSQSLNLFFKNITMESLSKAWTRGWARGLKTLSYYCRSRPATHAQKAQLESSVHNSITNSTNTNTQNNERSNDRTKESDGPVCSRDNQNCESCGS